MHANAVADGNILHVCSHFLDPPGNFMAESQGQVSNLGNARAIMRVRMADSAGRNTNQNVRRPNLLNWNVRGLQWLSNLDESNRSHGSSIPRPRDLSRGSFLSASAAVMTCTHAPARNRVIS